MAITRNLYYQRCRTLCREEPSNQIVDPGYFVNIEHDLIRGEIAAAVRSAVAALPLPQREAVFLFEFEGLSLAESAAILGIEANAMKARLHRARVRAGDLFKDIPGRGGPDEWLWVVILAFDVNADSHD
jgi:DNA-directed RNA polymerase specialized sigma24 family protein